MEHADKAPDGPQHRESAAKRAPGHLAAPAFVDNSAQGFSLRALTQMMNQSPQVKAQQALNARISGSPHMVAQRKQLESLFGDAAQRSAAPEEELLQGKFETVQRVEPEEEELLQGKFAPVQRTEPEEEELLQGKFAPVQRAEPDRARRANHTGLPDALKTGIEALSGVSLDGVKVHYNSSQPAQLNALAYAQGNDIHVAPGQERHLPHEAWHVVQQAQGRVQPTMQLKDGVAVNDDAGLEHEADVMGVLAAGGAPATAVSRAPSTPSARPSALMQRVIKIKGGTLLGEYDTAGGKTTKWLITETEKLLGKQLRRSWKKKVSEWAAADEKKKFPDTSVYVQYMLKRFKALPNVRKKKIRPNFPDSSYRLAKIAYGIQTGTDQMSMSPSNENLAMPHRFPYKAIEISVQRFIDGTEDEKALLRWTQRLIDATKERFKINYPDVPKGQQKDYKATIEMQIKEVENDRLKLSLLKLGGTALTLESPEVQHFLKWTNSLHGNIPDFGPHDGVNIQVSNRIHPHFVDGKLTPGSQAAMSMTPDRVPKGVAFTSNLDHLVTTDGTAFAAEDMEVDDEVLVKRHKKGATTIENDDL